MFLYFSIFLTVALLLSKTIRKTVAKWGSRMILFIMGWRFEVNKEYYEVDRQLILFPHTSGWELFLGILYREAFEVENVKIIVWDGQFHGPMGPLLRFLGCTAIDNQRKNGAVQTISDFLNAQGKFKFAMSPEGTRSFKEKFRSGFFYIARNTNSVYNIVTFDYEKHIIHFGNLMKPSGNFKVDCKRIAKAFGESIVLYPKCKVYGAAPHSHTSAFDYLCASNLVGLLNVWLLWNYHHPLFAGLSLLVTISSFLYHNSKEKQYRSYDWTCSAIYVVSLIYYRWFYTGVIWKLALLLPLWFFVFIQAGKNSRYQNENYRKWHVLYHLSTFPIAIAEIWLHS